MLRVQTDDGTCQVKAGQSIWIWAEQIVKVWEAEKSVEWPKWSMYAINQ